MRAILPARRPSLKSVTEWRAERGGARREEVAGVYVAAAKTIPNSNTILCTTND